MHTHTLPSSSSSLCPFFLVTSVASGAATAARTSGSAPASLMRFCNASSDHPMLHSAQQASSITAALAWCSPHDPHHRLDAPRCGDAGQVGVKLWAARFKIAKQALFHHRSV